MFIILLCKNWPIGKDNSFLTIWYIDYNSCYWGQQKSCHSYNFYFIFKLILPIILVI